MRPHILLMLLTLILSACASHRDIAGTTDRSGYNTEQSQHAQLMDAAASARGNSRQ
jgi:hypothetical protein